MTTIEKTAMTGSELKCHLGALGIPPSFIASKMGVTMRTVVRWFDSESVSPEVVAVIDDPRDATDSEMARLRKAADSRRNEPVVLQTYRTDDEYPNADDMPATWHRQVVYRLMEKLREEGKTVTVQYA